MDSCCLRKFKQFVSSILICCALTLTSAIADELKLRDGFVVQADQIWESNGQIWFRQGQTVRSIPKSEVLAYGAKLPINEPVKTKKNSPTSRRQQALVPTPVPAQQEKTATAQTGENVAAITRIIFKDGGQIDVDLNWDAGNKIGYRLGTMYSFIDKSVIQQVLPNYSPSQINQIEKTAPSGFPYSTGNTILDSLITSNATRHNIDPLLIYFVMRQESSFKVRAISRVGARGLMQLMPATARQLGVRNIDDPNENVEAGTRHLKYLLDRYNGDVNLVLAAYNAGEEAVARYGNRVPPYRETQNYVRTIGWAYYRARQ